MAQRFEFAQPSGEHCGDLVEWELGVDVQVAFGLAVCKTLRRAIDQPALEFWKRCSGKRKADCEGVSAKASEEIGAGFDGREQVELIDRAARAVRDAIFDADDESRLGGALDYARRCAVRESEHAAACAADLPPSPQRESLLELASFAARRTY